MKNKRMTILSIGIVLVLGLSAIGGSASFNLENLIIKPKLTLVSQQVIEVEKLVYDGNSWVDSINAEIGDVLLFNISIRYNPTPLCGKILNDINVTDTLPPCLTYNPNSAEIYNYDGNIYYPTDETSGNKIFWNLTQNHGIRHFAFPEGSNFTYILFEATVIAGTDENGEENEVCVDAYETCCNEDRYTCDTATVIVLVIYDIELDKYVKHLGQWAGYTEVIVGDTVEFKHSPQQQQQQEHNNATTQ
jgi:uncharacterized repeat protein (TIGR01451 family)